MAQDRHDTTRVLQAASQEYTDLPEHVADRLDHVLDQLPAADTLHQDRAPAPHTPLRERLGLGRVRFAIAGAAAALLVTVGAVGLAVQVVSEADDDGSTAAELSESESLDESEDQDGAAEEGPDAEDFKADENETNGAGPDASGEISGVETFTTGSDYGEDTDLLSALRALDSESDSGAVPDELTELAEGGTLWEHCQQALTAGYDSLLVAADFARFESQPAVMALLLTDSGEIAVAVTPDCADGEVDELHSQS